MREIVSTGCHDATRTAMIPPAPVLTSSYSATMPLYHLRWLDELVLHLQNKAAVSCLGFLKLLRQTACAFHARSMEAETQVLPTDLTEILFPTIASGWSSS